MGGKISVRTRSSLKIKASALLLAFLGSCANTRTEIISRDSLIWVKSNEEPQVLVVKSENESISVQSSILLPDLDDLVIDYKNRTIDVPVSYGRVEKCIVVETREETRLENEATVSTIVAETTDLSRCHVYVYAGTAVGGLAGMFVAAPLASKGNEKVAAFLLGLPLGALTGIITGAYIGEDVNHCIQEWHKSTKVIDTKIGPLTSNQRTVKTESMWRLPPQRKTHTKELLKSGILEVEGDNFGQREFPIRDGHASISVPPLPEPYVFARYLDALRKTDLSWVKPVCRPGVEDYLMAAADSVTLSLTVSARKDRGGEPATKTYDVPILKLPDHDDIINYVVNKHINERIQDVTLSYLDLDDHTAITNLQVTISPRGVPKPNQLVAGCFEHQRDRATAIGFVKDYTYEPFETRVNKEQSFSALLLFPYTLATKLKGYRFQSGTVQFKEGALNKEIYLTELGSKLRVLNVRE